MRLTESLWSAGIKYLFLFAENCHRLRREGITRSAVFFPQRRHQDESEDHQLYPLQAGALHSGHGAREMRRVKEKASLGSSLSDACMPML